MSKAKIEKIIEDIFEPLLLGDKFSSHKLNTPPTYKEISKFANLILKDESEESFQKYISQNPHYLFRLAPSTDDTSLGLLAKPPISVFNTADFGILSVSQSGSRIFLIEIERPSDKLFTKKLTPAQKLQTAIGQVNDWDQWIRSNKKTLIDTYFKLLKNAPKFPDKDIKGSFIYCDKSKIESIWSGFGGADSCTIEYLIIIGRWSKLTEEEKKRLVFLNQKYENINLKIRTYDNVVRKAIEGPKQFW